MHRGPVGPDAYVSSDRVAMSFGSGWDGSPVLLHPTKLAGLLPTVKGVTQGPDKKQSIDDRYRIFLEMVALGSDGH